MTTPNNKQVAIVKRLINEGRIPPATNVVIKEHEVYCYLPTVDNVTEIIAIHTSGIITNHIHTTS